MSKYNPLWDYLKNTNLDQVLLTFEEIEKEIGLSINHSFLTFKKELLEYGYEVKKISIRDKTVLFKRLN